MKKYKGKNMFERKHIDQNGNVGITKKRGKITQENFNKGRSVRNKFIKIG